MASSSIWVSRHRNQRLGRLPHSQRNKEKDANFQLTDDHARDIIEILTIVCKENDVSDCKRINYLNSFVKIALQIENNFGKYGFNMQDILCCLRIPLIHQSMQVRSGGLRAIRHILKNEEDIEILNHLLIPYLIARSLDLTLQNDMERLEVIKLIRKILLLAPNNFDASLARCLIALANAGYEEKDRMLRICLATLCELGIVNSQLFIEVGGVTAITRNLLECHTPKIAEALCSVLLYLLDKPHTRDPAKIDLHSIAAPYCDFHYRHGWNHKDKRDEREMRFNCSRLALLSILRSWSGILEFCSPKNKAGLKAIIDALYLNQLEVRKAVLDLLYELLGLPQPEWTDELSVALSAVDPCEPHSSWRLNEGFVAAEGRAILPHLAKYTPSINDMHLALLIYCFLECRLLDALTEVIVTSDTFISVRATVLLGELLHLSESLLPNECCKMSSSLPILIDYAANGKPQAMKAITSLQQLNRLLRKRPSSYSLHLDFILRSGKNLDSDKRLPKREKLKHSKSKLHRFIMKDGDDVLKQTGVLFNNDAYTWNWNLIRIILKHEIDFELKLDEANHRTFIKQIIEFYTPSRNRYSHMDLNMSKINLAYTIVGTDLINCLIDNDSNEAMTFLTDFFTDILRQIKAISSGKSVHDCLFSPQHMVTTQCQSYFLFVGRLATKLKGIDLLNRLNLFEELQALATTTNNDCYVKLIISSLDYSKPGKCRDLLKAVLQCPVENSRFYATQFLLVLLRAGMDGFSDWGIRMLIDQLQDHSKCVGITSLICLHEACECDEYLEALIRLKPDLTRFGEKGCFLTIRLYSSPYHFSPNESLIQDINHWVKYMNYRYVKLIEGETNDTLTLHQRNSSDLISKITMKINNRRDCNFLLPHLYGQLVQHLDGFKLLVEHGNIENMLKELELARCETDNDVFELKACLWAIGHFASSSDGINYIKSYDTLNAIIGLVQKSTILSIRATAFYILGLIANTHEGADELLKSGWFSTRHSRQTCYPVIEEEMWNNENLNVSMEFQDLRFNGGTDLLSNMSGCSKCYQKSSTMPMNQRLIGTHKRSLSESKTFEIVKCINSDLTDEYNYNKAESTTSGISSSDSIRNPVYEHEVLSPIPSSSSLSTLKRQWDKIRRHSESSKKSSTRSNSIKSSPSPIRSDRIPWLASLRLSSKRNQNSQLELSNENNSFLSISSLNEFSESSQVMSNGKCYMGICLPKDLSILFPEQKRFHVEKQMSEDDLCTASDSLASKIIEYEHDRMKCLRCIDYDKVNTDWSTDTVLVEIINYVYQLANPFWNKQMKQMIFQKKQECPQIFENACLYSEVCKIISEEPYRLNTRRMLHELFLDVNYQYFYKKSEKILNEFKRLSGHCQTQSIKLDSLKLAYKENKFPIKKRNESKFV